MFAVKPASSDLVLIGPDGRQVPAAGITVPELTRFWRRRKADGDAVITEVMADTAADDTATSKKKG